MRLCHVVASLEQQYGGPSKSVLRLGQALAETGNEVELLATDPSTPSQQIRGRLQIEIFRRDWPSAFCPSAGLRERLVATKSQVLHNHGLWLRTLGYAANTARQQGIPLVISPRGMMGAWAWNHHRLRKQLASLMLHPGALAQARGWHATSKEEADDIRRIGFRAPVCIAPNGVAAPDEAARITEAAAWRQLLPQAKDCRIALFYSRFHSKKRVRELIELWSKTATPGWLLLLVGIPEEYDVASLSAYAASLGSAERIAVFSGTNVPPPYAIASLFILPSHNENFGMSIAEAMTYEVPVLVTDTTPWKLLTEAGNGWCVPWTGFSTALERALTESPASLEARGKRAREWVLSGFSWERSAEILAQFYGSLT